MLVFYSFLCHYLAYVSSFVPSSQEMSVSQPGDSHEVEADRMAQAVMRMETAPPALHRQPEVTKDPDEEKKKVHRSADSWLGLHAGADLHET